MTGLCDAFQRPINYLRISVTDRCNLRCIYCMPPQGIPVAPHSDILRYEEILHIVRVAVALGITRVRLTGGEPLVRSDLVALVRMLARVEGIEDISLTSNGVLLGHYARSLKEAGLHRVNVSLDSLHSDRFQYITRWGRLDDVLEGMRAAREAGLHPIKVNMVVMRGINDDEFLDFAGLTFSQGWHVRFIELMPLSSGGGSPVRAQGQRFMSISEMWSQLESLGPLEPCLPSTGNGPAKYFRFSGAPGTIGFISPISEHFCFGCNRLRLTADGKLRPCLLSDEEIDLRGPVRRGASTEELTALIKEAVALKPAGHQLAEGVLPRGRGMSHIGG